MKHFRHSISSKYFRLGTYSLAGMTGYMVYHLPNFTLLQQLQNFKQQYKSGEPIPVPPHIEKLSETVLNDLKWSKEDREKVKLFTNSRFDFFHAGSVCGKIIGIFRKAIIGLPVSCSWNEKHVHGQNLMVNGETVDVSSESGQKLCESLTLSEKAIKFALAQNYIYISQCEPLVKGALTASLNMLLLFYFYCNYDILVRFSVSHLPFHIAIFLLHISVWYMCKGVYNSHLERKTDKIVGKLGRSYVEGATELLESNLSRNRALRAMAKEKNKFIWYNLYGDEKPIIWEQHLPLTERKEYFMQLLN